MNDRLHVGLGAQRSPGEPLAPQGGMAGAHQVALLAAASARAVAAALLQGLRAAGAATTTTDMAVAWQEGQSLAFEPPGAHTELAERCARAACSGHAPAGAAGPADPAAYLLDPQATEDKAVLLLQPGAALLPGHATLLALAGRRMAELLQVQRLQSSVRHLEQAERLQRALFAMADMAASDLDMQSLLQRLHQTMQTLMYAENFYIALYDKRRETLRFIYFVDEMDGRVYAPDQEYPAAKLGNSITVGLIRHAKAVRGPAEQVAEGLGLDRTHPVGTPAVDFMGVPMRRGGEILGVLAVQSYQAGRGYTDADQQVLAVVAEHVLNAVERKMGQEALERRVTERTQALAEANARLHEQVRERERATHLQATLYRIAALGHGHGDHDMLYRSIHQAVGELLAAENFYIALLSRDGARLDFPYGVDTQGVSFPARPFGHGMTEYVVRQARTVLMRADEISALVAAGEIDMATYHTPARSWLGAPLLGTHGVMGVVAVQSYRADLRYTSQDADLLTFVSYQLASTLQRLQQEEALQTLNVELEQRVQARTQELRAQIAVREEVQERLKHQVMHDPLTGLPNRLYLRDRLERALGGLQRNPLRRFALLYLDVDRFKLFNDSFGHQTGDAVLREVSARLQECVRKPDVAGRLSGDEFSILLEDCPQAATASAVAQRIQARMQEPILDGGRTLHVSVSIGIAMSHTRYTSVDAMLHDADTALYRAKAAGRQRFVLFDETQHSGATNVLALEQQMRSALEADEFEPHLQPIVELAGGTVVGYEALIRWRHPTRGLLGPAEFLPAAEATGLIEDIDWHMYRMACIAGTRLLQGNAYLNLNISPRHFRSPGFDKRLLALARTAGLAPARLCVEVTEGTLLHDPEAVAQVLYRLNEAGVRTALDDFGTGYSSLSHVHRFPIATLKIDRSFVKTLGQQGQQGQQRSLAIIAAVLGMARSLEIDVVAEGVETQVQRQVLQSMGCAYGQGYLFGRAEPVAYWQAHRGALGVLADAV